MGSSGIRLGLTLGGGLLGRAFGGPIGGAIGAIAGSVLGNVLFPADGPDDIINEGPRLGDLAVTSSTFGAPIFIGYGTMKLSGNMVWATPLEEVRTVTESGGDSGGKGGAPDEPTTTNVTYSYFGSFAIGFAEGTADRFVRIYADSKLIYDASETGFDTIRAGFTTRFYKGSETQLPDPIIIDDKGADALAYRDLCYIVFDRIPLASFGNRIPNITAEITFKGTDQFPEDLSVNLTGSPPITIAMGPTSMAIDWDRGLLYGVTNDAGGPTTSGISVFDLRTFKEVRQQISDDIVVGGGDIGITALTVLPSGNLYTTAGELSNSEPVILINPDTLRETDRFGVSSGALNMSKTQWENINSNGKNSWISLYGLLGRENYIFAASLFNSVGILREKKMEYVWDSDIEGLITSARILCLTHGKIGIAKGEGWIAHGHAYGTGASTLDIEIDKIVVEQSALFDQTGSIDITHGVSQKNHKITMADLTAAGFPDSPANVHGVGGIIHDPIDDTIIFIIDGDALGKFVFKWDQTTGIKWFTEVTGFGTWSGTQPALFNKARMGGGTIGFGTGGEAALLDTASGEIIFSSNNPSEWDETMTFGGAWDSWNASLAGGVVGKLQRMWLDRHSGAGTTVEEVVKDVTNRVGLDNADRDTADLTSMILPGYVITRRMSARAAIEPLARFFLFEGTEIDDRLAFIEKGNAASVTITEKELAVINPQSGEFFQETRQQEIELPERFEIAYIDPTNDYQPNIHAAKRITLPAPSMHSRNKIGFNIAAALLTDTVKQTAEKLLYTSWIERNSYVFHLPWKFLDLVPTDVVDITMDSGNVFRARIVKEDVGLDLKIQISALAESLAQYTSTVVGDSGTVPQQQVPSSSATKGFILDIPLLRDADDVFRTETGLYAFAGGFGQPGWEAAFVFKSNLGTNFVPQTRVTGEMAYGSTKNALPDTVTPHQTNEVDTLEVFMTVGSSRLVTITQAQLLDGGNPALLFNAANDNFEVIQFRDVLANDSGSFTLSGLIRGQRGTRVNAALREVGETFLLLEPANAEHFPNPLTYISVQRFFKTVGRGQLFEDVDPTTLTTIGRDLKPYMPAHFAGAEDASGNIDFTWVRCTRVGAALRDKFGDVPVSEDSILYDLLIYDGVTLKRTITGLTTEVHEYLSADIITDFGAVPASLEVEIFQVSGQVGRGLVRKETIQITPF